MIIDYSTQSCIYLPECLSRRRDESTLRAVSVCLVLRTDDRDLPIIVTNQDNLGMVHRQIYVIEAVLHKTIQIDGLLRCLQVGDKHRMVDEPLAAEPVEARQESVRRRKRADVDIGRPGLLENPVKQTERMKSDAKVGLTRAILERLEY